MVLPGIIDAHTHPALSAQDLGKYSLEDRKLTLAQLRPSVERCLKDNPGNWAVRDNYIVDGTLPYIGPERAKYLYPARSLRDAGAFIVGGSDWDVSSFDAFEAMEHAITRSEGRGKPSLLPEQGISLQNMVDGYMIKAASALKQERSTGSLETGKRGDFILLDRNIFAIDPYERHETRVPLLAVSPFAQAGSVDHAYNDHASILKFIERNWGLPPLFRFTGQ